jgi:hypothetical protein
MVYGIDTVIVDIHGYRYSMDTLSLRPRLRHRRLQRTRSAADQGLATPPLLTVSAYSQLTGTCPADQVLTLAP